MTDDLRDTTTSETTESTETTEATTPEVQSPTMGEVLKGVEPTQTETPKETTEDAVTTETETKPEVKAEGTETTEPENKEEAATTPQTPAQQPQVPLSAFLAVKNQLKEAKEQRTETTDYDYQEPAPQPTQPQGMEFNTSLKLASISHKDDWNEKATAINTYLKDNQVDETTLRSIVESPDPGEAFYQAGKTLVTLNKYGTTDPEQIARIASEQGKKDAFEEGKKAANAEFQDKIKKRSNTPTNILDSRAAGGDDKPDYVSPTMSDIFGGMRKKGM